MSSRFLYGPTRRAWLTLPRIETILYVGGEPRLKPIEDDPYDHDRVMLELKAGVKTFFIDLTSMTKEELDCWRTLIEIACDAAEPVCVSLDAFAQQEMEDGAVMLAPRVFRSAPSLIVRNTKARTVKGRANPTDNKENSDEIERSAYASEGPPQG